MDPIQLTRAQRTMLETMASRGPATASQLAESLGVSAVAVRQHLTRLGDDGLVRAEPQTGEVGRPASVWSLTAAGRHQLPDAHRGLAVELLRAVDGPQLAEVLARRTAQQTARYREHVDASLPLAERVQQLAGLRSAEGYLADSWIGDDGAIYLAENHCPLRCAVDACVGLCSAEVDLFSQVLGRGVRIHREEHIPAGASRCLYRVWQD